MSRFGRRGDRPPKEPVPEADAGLVETLGEGVPISLVEVEKDMARTGCTCRVEHASHTETNWGNRHGNEDRVMKVRGNHAGHSFHTIGVLDGHDTEMASDAVSKLFPPAVAKHLKAGHPVEEAFRVTMAECEKALSRTVQTAGTCVCSCLVAGRHVWCGNLGDCRSCLITLQVPESASSATKCTSCVWMSKDHKGSVPEEIARIRALGGRVSDGRIEGLEPSRTLGDFDVKAATPPGVISIIPEVRCHAMGENGLPDQAVIVCATDGVWDVISGQDICDLIHARRELAGVQYSSVRQATGSVDNAPLKVLAEDLVQFAVARGSHDDCTAVVALVTVRPPGD